MEAILVQERVFVGADGRETIERIVQCPDRGLVDASACTRCPRFFEFDRDDRCGGEVVDCARAAAPMSYEGLHHVAVVDETGVACGLVSSLDVLRWLGHRGGMSIPRSTRRQARADETHASRTRQ